MTVKDMKDELSKYPDDMRVIYYDNGTQKFIKPSIHADALWFYGQHDNEYDKYQFDFWEKSQKRVSKFIDVGGVPQEEIEDFIKDKIAELKEN